MAVRSSSPLDERGGTTRADRPAENDGGRTRRGRRSGTSGAAVEAADDENGDGADDDGGDVAQTSNGGSPRRSRGPPLRSGPSLGGSWCRRGGGGGARQAKWVVALVFVCAVQVAVRLGQFAKTGTVDGGSGGGFSSAFSAGPLLLPPSSPLLRQGAATANATNATARATASRRDAEEEGDAKEVGSDDEDESCLLRIHSREWLDGPRIGNEGEHFPPGYVERMLLTGEEDGPGRMGLLFDGAVSARPSDEDAGLLPLYLSQSLCHGRSRFRSVDLLDEASSTDDDDLIIHDEGVASESEAEMPPHATVKAWTTRLVYLAMIRHQHRHAYAEAAARYGKAGASGPEDDRGACRGGDGGAPYHLLSARHGVGSYDYECRSAKFILASLGGVGIGANVRGGIVEALLAGLTSDRVVLFVNNSPVGHRLLKRPWALASCPRGDYQCFFFPPTPCALTHTDIAGAYSLTRSEVMGLRKGQVPFAESGVLGAKVWHMTLTYMPHRQIPPLAAERLYNHTLALLGVPAMIGSNRSPTLSDDSSRSNNTANSQLNSRRREVLLRAAARRILRRDEPRRPLYNYAAANVPIHHALALFATRPNLRYAEELSRLLSPAENDEDAIIDPDHTVGLPIRASDKCVRESECLSFRQHLEATSALLQEYHGEIWPRTDHAAPSFNHSFRGEPDGNQRGDGGGPTLLVTTESLEVAREFRTFRANRTAQLTLPYRFRLVTNDADVTPDTGFLGATNHNATFTADEAMLSALSTLQRQLLARVTVANCCSNFHVLLADLLSAGCGASSDHRLHCLQEHPDPRYQVCCGWFPNCKEEKRLAIEQMEKAAAAALPSS